MIHIHHRDRLLEELHEALIDEATRRDSRPVYGPDGWIELERKRMLAEVNTRRIMAFRAPLLLEEIVRCENLALGHSDYGHKFALYCRELIERQ